MTNTDEKRANEINTPLSPLPRLPSTTDYGEFATNPHADAEVFPTMKKTNLTIDNLTLNRSIQSSNGETIYFSTVGPTSGLPIFVMPGLGNHRTLLLFFESFAIFHNLFLINMDRPGCGLSRASDHKRGSTATDVTIDVDDVSPHPCSRIEHVTQNALTLVSYLRLNDRIHVVGHSCGAIYATSLAVALKQKGYYVPYVFLMSPWVSLTNKKTSRFLRTVKSIFPHWAIFAGANSITGLQSVFLKSISTDSVLSKYSKREQEMFLREPEFKYYLFEILRLSNVEDSGGGAADAVFALEKVECFPDLKEILRDSNINVRVYHGNEDDMVPIEAIYEEFEDVHTVEKGTHHLIFDLEVWAEVALIIQGDQSSDDENFD